MNRLVIVVVYGFNDFRSSYMRTESIFLGLFLRTYEIFTSWIRGHTQYDGGWRCSKYPGQVDCPAIDCYICTGIYSPYPRVYRLVTIMNGFTLSIDFTWSLQISYDILGAGNFGCKASLIIASFGCSGKTYFYEL